VLRDRESREAAKGAKKREGIFCVQAVGVLVAVPRDDDVPAWNGEITSPAYPQQILARAPRSSRLRG
jgi:hypothetical protein